MNEKFDRSWLIHELAKRAEFTVGDTLILWKTFESIVQEIVINHDELNIFGLVKISITDVEEHEGFDNMHKKRIILPKTYRINWKSSMCLLDLLRPNNQKIIVEAKKRKKKEKNDEDE
jgi:hypothetical protein